MTLSRVRVATGEAMTADAVHVLQQGMRRDAPAWWVVTAFRCEDCICCDGYEVCLINKSRGCSSPTWPVLSCTSEADAQDWQQRLVCFAQTLSAEDPRDHKVTWEKPNARWDRRITDWLTGLGWEPFNHITWKLGVMEALALAGREAEL
jgi:hypothetical protein